MTDLIILHNIINGNASAVHLRNVEAIEEIPDGSTIHFVSGNPRSYRESLEEIFSIIRELDAEPPLVQRPAPSNMGVVKSKHGRVTE